MIAGKTRVLFVCDKNRLRSPTAERVFGDHPQLEVKSAGVDKDATVVVSRELLEWADSSGWQCNLSWQFPFAAEVSVSMVAPRGYVTWTYT